MKGTMTKTILQATAVLVAGIFLLGCPIDEEDIFTGDVKVTNNSQTSLEFISIHKSVADVGANLIGSPLVRGASVTYSGYDCATYYIVTVQRTVDGTDNPSTAFIPPCGGTETVLVTSTDA